MIQHEVLYQSDHKAELAAAATKPTNGYLETEEVEKNNTITYIPEDANSEDVGRFLGEWTDFDET